MLRLGLVCLGGALGSGARYLVAMGVTRAFGPDFPRGTVLINATGSFLISAIMHVSLATESISPEARLFLTTGVMGGFTTYSSFNYETIALFEQTGWALAALNLALTVVGCLVAGVLGLAAARAFVGH